jgi:hypothetical protein
MPFGTLSIPSALAHPPRDIVIAGRRIAGHSKRADDGVAVIKREVATIGSFGVP